MKTNNKLGAYILRGSMGALLFSCMLVALCPAIHLPEQPPAIPRQDNGACGANTHQNRSLNFADRVAYQRAIEEVYWRHRIWPNTNAGRKPALDAVMSQAQIEKKVEDYLRKSQTLEDDWQRPITAEQLQTEMARMASHSKQPEVLHELFAALENDPFVIAECLARPVLVERSANGDPVAAEPVPAIVATPLRGVARNVPQARGYSERHETRVPVMMAAVNSANYSLPVIGSPSGGCIDDTWTATTLINAPTPRVGHTAIWTGTEMIVWGGSDNNGQRFNTGGRYNPVTDSWTATSTTNAPDGRSYHTAVWTGTEMIIWGGGDHFNNIAGGRYNPSTDNWTATSTTNEPDARSLHKAVWTGSEMIVWGGFDGWGEYFRSGGRYDPATDSWTPTNTTNAPNATYGNTAVWTGSEMIVWGGWDGNTGGRYNPISDSWTATSTTNAPDGRSNHTAVWTGTEMIVWGGAYTLNTGGRYNPNTDTWTATSSTTAPSLRAGHTAVWTGTEMIVWGGMNDDPFPKPFNTGGSYDPSTDSWTAPTKTGAPAGRTLHTAVWTGSQMIVWGGFSDASLPSNTGGRYCAAEVDPTPTPTATPNATPTTTTTATPTATPTGTPSPFSTIFPSSHPNPTPRP